MQRTFVTMKYFETYYYANVVHNILTEPFAFLRNLNDWHEGNEEALFLQPFPKWSVLHSLSEFLLRGLLDEQVNDVNVDSMVNDPSAQLWVDEAMRYHGFSVPGFRQWIEEEGVALADVNEDHIADYHRELQLSGELEDLLEQLSNEVFYVLFGNRALLAKLNGYIAGQVSRLAVDAVAPEHKDRMAKNGQVKRAGIPVWAKKAVFYRDRGVCTVCTSDLSGLVSVQSEEHYDHILPLAQGGVNDVTNLQLLCGNCNRRKGRLAKEPSARYESWY